MSTIEIPTVNNDENKTTPSITKTKESSSKMKIIFILIVSLFFIITSFLFIIYVVPLFINEHKKPDVNKTIINDETPRKSSLKNENNELEKAILDGMRNIFNEHTLLSSLQKNLIEFDINNKIFTDCLSKNTCTIEEKSDTIYLLINRHSEYRKKLSTFVSNFILTNKTLPSTVYPEKGIFNFILDEYKQRTKEHRNCDIEPRQMTVYKLFESIMLRIKESYSIIEIAYMIKYREYIDNDKTIAEKYLNSAKEIIEDFHKDLDVIVDNAQWALNESSTEFYRCDPGEAHVKGETYDKFIHIFPIYVGNIYQCINHNPQFLTGFTDKNFNYIYLVNYCQEILHATNAIVYAEQSYTMNEPWIHHVEIFYKDGYKETFGKSNRVNKSLSVIYPPYDVKKYCQHLGVMLCPEARYPGENYGIRHISLKPVIASTDHVVTGIRWKFINKILYLEIQQAKFINDSIVNGTVHWKLTKEHNIENDTVSIGLDESSARGFGLIDIKLPTDYQMTGVQFDWDENILNNMNRLINIRILGTPRFQQAMKNRYEFWKEVENTYSNSATPIEIDKPDVSEYATENLIVSKSNKQFIHFQLTDLKKDASQTSIPYLDIQDVAMTQPAPINGIGIYYKGMNGFGGFIGLKIFSSSNNIDKQIIDNYSYNVNEIYDNFQNISYPVELFFS